MTAMHCMNLAGNINFNATTTIKQIPFKVSLCIYGLNNIDQETWYRTISNLSSFSVAVILLWANVIVAWSSTKNIPTSCNTKKVSRINFHCNSIALRSNPSWKATSEHFSDQCNTECIRVSSRLSDSTRQIEGYYGVAALKAFKMSTAC